jgi:hypothetical protein
MEADEKPVGEIEVTMKFWRGLSGYHKRYAQKERSGDMRNVMEVLDTVNDEIQSDSDSEDGMDSDSDSSDSDDDTKNGDAKSSSTRSKKLATHTNQSSDSDSDEGTKNPIKKAKKLTNEVMSGHNASDDGSRGAVGMMRDYKDHHRQLHRRHKGVMQWRGARTADWALSKVRHGKGRVEGLFEHSEKTPGVETEV